MPAYRRYRIPGGCYFFTFNLLERRPNDLLVRHVDLLRETVREVRQRRPFHIDGWVVLPDHLHCIWTLPTVDTDFTTRWRLIKAGFAKQLPKAERRSEVRVNRGERGIWQRRFWEHANHMDYLHFNPVKHGDVGRVTDWPYSSFIRCVERGLYPRNWAGAGIDADRVAGERG